MNTRGSTQLLTIGAALVGGLFLSGCNELTGRIQVNETIQLHTAKGDGIIQPGSYGATLDFPNKNKARLEIKVKTKKNNPSAIFHVNSRSFPKGRGPIFVSAKESGQPYDLDGTIDTEVSEGREQWASEPCTYRITEQVCGIDRRGRRSCWLEERTIYGNRDIRYFDRTTTQSVDLNILQPNTSHAVAQAYVDQSSNERIYTYQGRCGY